MKKLLLSLASVALCASFANAETLYELTFNKDNNQEKISAYDKTWDVISNGSTWTVSGYNNNNNGKGEENLGTDKSPQTPWTWVRCGRKKCGSTATISTKFPARMAISEIVIDAVLNGANSSTNLMTSAKLLIANDPTFAQNDIVETVSIPVDQFAGAKNAAKTISISTPNHSEGLYYQIVFEMTAGSSNGWLQVNSVNYIADGSLLDAEISFPLTTYHAALGMPFDSPVATAKSNGAITYSISNEGVATVDAETGEVTLVGDGTAVVTATVAATDTYKAGSASYTLIVADPSVRYSSALGEDFTFENVENQTYPWSHDDKYGLKGSGFVNKTVNACEGIAVSPVIDLTEYTGITLDFSNAFNNYKVDNTMIPVEEFEGFAYLVARVDGAGEWTVIEAAVTPPSAFSWDFYANDTVDLDAFAGKKMQFGFKYVSTSECAGTWEVNEIKLKGKLMTRVDGVGADDNSAPVYYNLQGVRVAQPESGLYIEVKGGKSRKVFIR